MYTLLGKRRSRVVRVSDSSTDERMIEMHTHIANVLLSWIAPDRDGGASARPPNQVVIRHVRNVTTDGKTLFLVFFFFLFCLCKNHRDTSPPLQTGRPCCGLLFRWWSNHARLLAVINLLYCRLRSAQAMSYCTTRYYLYILFMLLV